MAIFKQPGGLRRSSANTTELRFPVFYTIGITLVSGYLDAIGFISRHGLYISFMSGNGVRMATAFAEDDLKTAGAFADYSTVFRASTFGPQSVQLRGAHGRGMETVPFRRFHGTL